MIIMVYQVYLKNYSRNLNVFTQSTNYKLLHTSVNNGFHNNTAKPFIFVGDLKYYASQVKRVHPLIHQMVYQVQV